MADDGIRFGDAGDVTVVLDGSEFRLRRPTIAEQLRWTEELLAVGDWQRENTTDGVVPDASVRLAGWFRDVLVGLAVGEIGRLPDNPEAMPAWTANPTLGAELRIAWRSLPLDSGDLPSARLRRQMPPTP